MLKLSAAVFISFFLLQAQAQDRPVIFVHGMLGSGDTWSKTFQYFSAAGYQPANLHVLDWNSVGMNNKKATVQLDSLINQVISSSGSTQVDLVGHSAGGGLCYAYLKDSIKALQVAHYVHLASSKIAMPARVPTLNLYSTADKIVGGSICQGAQNIDIADKDHYQIATCKESALHMYAFFQNKTAAEVPLNFSSKKQTTYTIQGKVCSLGDNIPDSGASITIYEWDAKEGKRKSSVFETAANHSGHWGPFAAKAGVSYEFVVHPFIKTKRPVHYFMQPFTANDPLVYLRTLPASGMAAMLLSALPKKTDECALAIFISNGAVINGRDQLFINEVELSTEELSPEKKTAIAHFIYDDGDKISSGKALGMFKMMPFMNGADVLLSANDTTPVNIQYNGKMMKVPRIKSSEGIMVAVLR